MSNPLLDERFIDFLLDAVHPLDEVLARPMFADHDRETCALYLDGARRLAREVLWPTYKLMDEEPPELVDGRVKVHPSLKGIYRHLVEMGSIIASRSPEVGGAGLPQVVATMAEIWMMAGNGAAVGYPLLTAGAGHLIEAFGDETSRALFLEPMYAGRWTGTMALTEPQAGSSLADLTTKATPTEGGTYRLVGSKIFISGGDQDLTENVVHLTLARIEGAPAGTRGISLFAVPRLRPEGDELVDNDVIVSQLLHKIGWKGLPSLGISLGERGDCHGWLIGEPGHGLKAMFQMMNAARLSVGSQASATAAVAYYESLAYARERTQGRPLGVKDPTTPPVPLTTHPDVRRMLLRQKAIVEGSIALVVGTARWTDLARAAETEAERTHAALLVEILTPIVKTFPSEFGFDANVLAVQIHGGYGYTSEYVPEALMRDQKLNTIHEGTTGIQGLDLLGRKAMMKGGAALRALATAIGADVKRARAAEIEPAMCDALDASNARFAEVTMALGMKGMQGDVEGMLLHSTDYLTALSIHVVAWQWLRMVAAGTGSKGNGAKTGGSKSADAALGRRQAARYWFAAEVPRIAHLLSLCAEAEGSYREMQDAWF